MATEEIFRRVHPTAPRFPDTRSDTMRLSLAVHAFPNWYFLSDADASHSVKSRGSRAIYRSPPHFIECQSVSLADEKGENSSCFPESPFKPVRILKPQLQLSILIIMKSFTALAVAGALAGAAAQSFPANTAVRFGPAGRDL